MFKTIHISKLNQFIIFMSVSINLDKTSRLMLIDIKGKDIIY